MADDIYDAEMSVWIGSPAELESLSSRLRELRCELAEVETAVREDDQRKQHLTRLRRDRPRRQVRTRGERCWERRREWTRIPRLRSALDA